MHNWKKAIMEVKDFYEKFNQSEYIGVGELEIDRLFLRQSLLIEEYTEYKEARENGDKVKMLDACCDMLFIYVGTLLEKYGDVDKIVNYLYFKGNDRIVDKIFEYINTNDFKDVFWEAFEEVYKSNMSKLGIDGKPVIIKEGIKKGKIGKGPNYFKPNLEKILEV